MGVVQKAPPPGMDRVNASKVRVFALLAYAISALLIFHRDHN